MRRRWPLLLSSLVVLFSALSPVLALWDDEDGLEPEPYALTLLSFVALQPGDLACTGVLPANTHARILYQLNAAGTPQKRAKLTLRRVTGSTETVVYFSRIDETPPGITAIVDINVSAGSYRACIRNPGASGVVMSVNGSLQTF